MFTCARGGCAAQDTPARGDNVDIGAVTTDDEQKTTGTAGTTIKREAAKRDPEAAKTTAKWEDIEAADTTIEKEVLRGYPEATKTIAKSEDTGAAGTTIKWEVARVRGGEPGVLPDNARRDADGLCDGETGVLPEEGRRGPSDYMSGIPVYFQTRGGGAAWQGFWGTPRRVGHNAPGKVEN